MPLERFEMFAEVVFLNLFLRLVNEPERQVRSLVQSCLAKVIEKSRKNFTEIVLKMDASNEVLINGKLQAISLLAQVENKLQKKDDVK